ncbi:MAG: hypothetical protein P0S93_02185 [Candidatus Neptunochlamydia sp.]|nr:hypothetical protein [Candidatus Neptunochlamydia sp.]
MEFQQLLVVTVPLLAILKEQVIDLLVAEMIFAFLALSLDSSAQMV